MYSIDQRITSMVPAGMRFKIGVCFDPPLRLHGVTSTSTAPLCYNNYAYMNQLTQRKDGVRYEEMIVMFSCHNRTTVNMLESSLIEWSLQTHGWRCANRKKDYDQNHCGHEDSDSADEHGSGPHQCYLVWGAPKS